MYKILIADDEVKITQTIKDYLSAKGFCVSTASNGEEAVELCEENEFDLIILDVMMPRLNGIEACRIIKTMTKAPVLFLSALGEERDLLNGFQSGCDDYMVKPFPLSVLNEKCHAMIKRYRGADSNNIITLGDIQLDVNRRKILVNSNEVKASYKDYELLSYLIQNKGRVLSRETILSSIWGYDFDGTDRVVDTHIKRLRQALGKASAQIKTCVGAGYMIEEK